VTGRTGTDEIWNEATKHHDEQALAALIISITTTNVWNRLNVAARQAAGECASSGEAQRRAASR
jgi:hypothetical protein